MENSRYKRRRLYARNPYCWICGIVMLFRDSSIDHIIPLSKGGADNLTNVKLAHHWCNTKRGSNEVKVVVDWQYIYNDPPLCKENPEVIKLKNTFIMELFGKLHFLGGKYVHRNNDTKHLRFNLQDNKVLLFSVIVEDVKDKNKEQNHLFIHLLDETLSDKKE